MAEFSFVRHDRYPGVDLQITIDPTITGSQTAARVWFFVASDTQAREPVVEDLKLWLSRHKVLTASRTVPSCCDYRFELKGWAAVADFIVTWIGVDMLSGTMQEREFLERRIFGEVRALTHQVEALTSKISRLEAVMQR